jgi:exopolyphosphatase/guanosine-5'-triphosphate,3'-diphosphate pyrophosphatase
MLSTLPPSEGRIAAFMDIGTNSVRLLLVRINPNHTHTILTDQKEIVRLGEEEFVDNYLQPEAMRQPWSPTSSRIWPAPGAKVNAVATSATREAENQDEFLRLLKREAQLNVRVISGKRKPAWLPGVASGVHLGAGRRCLSISAAAVEVIIGDRHQYLHADRSSWAPSA